MARTIHIPFFIAWGPPAPRSLNLQRVFACLAAHCGLREPEVFPYATCQENKI